MDVQHASRYDAIMSRKICAPNYLDVEMLTTLHLYDDLYFLLHNLGWENFVAFQETIYERLSWEFMSSLIVDLYRKFDEVKGYIRLSLVNHTHEMYFVRFNELLCLSACGATISTHADYNPKSFWTTLTCSGWRHKA